MSRPEKPIDWAKVDQLLIAGCKGTEIAPHFDMHYETFYDRVKAKYGMGFTEYCSIKKEQGISLIKAKQYELAMKGNVPMLIWLGKVSAGQRENDQSSSQDTTYKVNYTNGNSVEVLPKELPTSSAECPE